MKLKYLLPLCILCLSLAIHSSALAKEAATPGEPTPEPAPQISTPSVFASSASTVLYSGGKLTTYEEHNPCVIAKGNITLSELTATSVHASGAQLHEGGKLTLSHTALTGANAGIHFLPSESSNDTPAQLTVYGGSIVSTAGPLFDISGVNTQITLDETSLATSSGVLLSSKLAADALTVPDQVSIKLTCSHQFLGGDIVGDDISDIHLTLLRSSTFTGAISPDNSAGFFQISLTEDSVWQVSADSYVDVLLNADETLSNIISQGFTIYYDASQADNEWLKAQAYELSGGGALVPISS